MNSNYYTKGLLLSGLLLLIVSCGKKNTSEDATADQLTITGDTVIVPEHSSVLSKLKVGIITRQDYASTCTTAGTVKPLAGHLAEIASPFEGRIVRSRVKLGQPVTSGMPLFEITSSAYFDAVKSFMQAKQTMLLNKTNYLRRKDLTNHGIGSQKELEEAASEYQSAVSDYERAKATLGIFHISTKNLTMSRPLIIRSPISGEVVKNDLVVGQYLKTDNEAVVTVADLNKVWVVAQVKENHIGEISHQDNVTVTTESNPEEPVQGVVDYIGKMMDEQTRSVEVYVVCNNHHHLLKPGMFVTANFQHHHKNAIILPSTAILQQDDRSYVFVQTGKKQFVKRQVVVASDGEKNQVVKSGLSSNERIVFEGGIYLR